MYDYVFILGNEIARSCNVIYQGQNNKRQECSHSKRYCQEVQEGKFLREGSFHQGERLKMWKKRLRMQSRYLRKAFPQSGSSSQSFSNTCIWSWTLKSEIDKPIYSDLTEAASVSDNDTYTH